MQKRPPLFGAGAVPFPPGERSFARPSRKDALPAPFARMSYRSLRKRLRARKGPPAFPCGYPAPPARGLSGDRDFMGSPIRWEQKKGRSPGLGYPGDRRVRMEMSLILPLDSIH